MSIWLVALGLLIQVGAIGWVLINGAMGHFSGTPDSLLEAGGCFMFGALGGCTYCLRAVYLNACVRKEWDSDWLPWYFIRPAVSSVLGGVSYLFMRTGLLLLGADQQPESSQLGVWAIAFLAGLNVDKFVAKIENVGQSVLGLEPSRQSKPDAIQRKERNDNP